MATKKKTFDAVREARLWRRMAATRRAGMTPTEYREYLRRLTEEFLAARQKRSGHAAVLSHR
jgi:hypothetical protein